MGGAVLSRITPLLVFAVAGCNAYDPDLGPHPFLCANVEPRCPDGYVCVTAAGSNADVCARPDDTVGGGADGGVQCEVDGDREPNDTTETATMIATGSVPLDAVLCPQTDVDFYHLTVNTTGQAIRVDVTYPSTKGSLQIDLLNSTGVVIRSASQVGNDPDHLRVDFENLASGAYYARVQPMGASFRTGYHVTFLVSTSPLPP